MYYIKMTFIPLDNKCLDEERLEQLWYYLAALLNNNQILEDYELIETKQGFEAFLTIPELNALDDNDCHIYAKKYFNQLKSQYSISIDNLGKNLAYESTCSCQNSSWYILYANHMSTMTSPIMCGDCYRSVPLYQLPFLPDKDEHFVIISWWRAYFNVDRLWMYGLSDRFTYRQLSDPFSTLAKEAKRICRQLEQVTGKDCYYCYYHSGLKGKKAINCLSCGNQLQPLSDQSYIHSKCDTCRLVAD